MNRSVLLRLLPASRTGPRLAGTAEIVETGERQAFRDAEELMSLLARVHAEAPGGLAEPSASIGGERAGTAATSAG